MLLSASRLMKAVYLSLKEILELDGETPDNVGVEIWNEHSVEEGFN